MTDKETLLTDLHSLDLHFAYLRQEQDWTEAQKTAEAIAKTCKDLANLEQQKRDEAPPAKPVAPIGMTSEQMKHILTPPLSFR